MRSEGAMGRLHDAAQQGDAEAVHQELSAGLGPRKTLGGSKGVVGLLLNQSHLAPCFETETYFVLPSFALPNLFVSPRRITVVPIYAPCGGDHSPVVTSMVSDRTHCSGKVLVDPPWLQSPCKKERALGPPGGLTTGWRTSENSRWRSPALWRPPLFVSPPSPCSIVEAPMCMKRTSGVQSSGGSHCTAWSPEHWACA